ncbi:MAG: hypothetical protein ACM3TU_00925 [Bacillota bacterium]
MRLRPPAGVPVKYRLGIVSSVFLLLFGGGIDTSQFLLSFTGIGEVGSEVIGLVGMLLIPLTAFMMGVRFDIGTIATFLSGDALEFIPFINDLPAFTAQVIGIVLISRNQDIQTAMKKGPANTTADTRAIIRQQHIGRVRQRLQSSTSSGQSEEREAA